MNERIHVVDARPVRHAVSEVDIPLVPFGGEAHFVRDGRNRMTREEIPWKHSQPTQLTEGAEEVRRLARVHTAISFRLRGIATGVVRRASSVARTIARRPRVVLGLRLRRRFRNLRVGALRTWVRWTVHGRVAAMRYSDGQSRQETREEYTKAETR